MAVKFVRNLNYMGCELTGLRRPLLLWPPGGIDTPASLILPWGLTQPACLQLRLWSLISRTSLYLAYILPGLWWRLAVFWQLLPWKQNVLQCWSLSTAVNYVVNIALSSQLRNWWTHVGMFSTPVGTEFCRKMVWMKTYHALLLCNLCSNSTTL